ncbi:MULTISPECIES: RagB/SusD family nutrient uptake outer membrane protein [Sanguibacteroides]|nr:MULTISPECIES: RagB/SusD family nutrient uptake outer membrane protein [Sanguibacteroides]PXZ43785.1 RagB/SusD family nutrient uptake outer membrane protein [Sanguibacteroides justesenii]
MMKKYIGIGLIVLSCCWGCTGMLDVRPENSVTFNNYFDSEQDAEFLLNALMDQVRTCLLGGPGFHAVAGAIMDTTSFSDYYNALNLRPDTYKNSVWTSFYYAIDKADLILNNAHRFPFSQDKLKPYLLQCYFAKALCYFFLARDWGEVPIIRGEKYTPLAKSSVAEVLKEAEELALKAMDLPIFEELKDYAGNSRTLKQYGSKGAVAALLAHICAWRAGVLNEPEYWKKAEEYCSMIIDGKVGFYDLESNPELVAEKTMYRDSKESIFEIFRSVQEEINRAPYFGTQYVGWPVRLDRETEPNWVFYAEIFKTTVNDMYDWEDLRRDSWFWALDADTIYLKRVDGKIEAHYSGEEYLNERPFFKINLASLGGKYRVLARASDTTGGSQDSTDWPQDSIPNDTSSVDTLPSDIIRLYDNRMIEKAFVNKFRTPYYKQNDYEAEPVFSGLDMNKVIWRLADIILLRAECKARQGKAGGAEDLNRIRERAYGNRNHDYSVAEGDLQYAVFKEREKELIFEDHRYYDAVRNGWDYVRRELSGAYRRLTDEELKDGALYYPVFGGAFVNNNLMRQNTYWNKLIQ